jgi:hypothetical protein
VQTAAAFAEMRTGFAEMRANFDKTTPAPPCGFFAGITRVWAEPAAWALALSRASVITIGEIPSDDE